MHNLIDEFKEYTVSFAEVIEDEHPQIRKGLVEKVKEITLSTDSWWMLMAKLKKIKAISIHTHTIDFLDSLDDKDFIQFLAKKVDEKYLPLLINDDNEQVRKIVKERLTSKKRT